MIVGSKPATKSVLVHDPIVLEIRADDKEAGNAPQQSDK